MRNFVSRCSLYIVRADDINNINESPWAIPFLVEKIYANLNSWDRKILKSGAGKSEDIQELSEKADELLGMSEDVVGSLNPTLDPPPTTNHPAPRADYQTGGRGWHSQPPYPQNYRRRASWQNNNWGNHGGYRQQSQGFMNHDRRRQGEATHPTHKPRPGGGAALPSQMAGRVSKQKSNNGAPVVAREANPLN